MQNKVFKELNFIFESILNIIDTKLRVVSRPMIGVALGLRRALTCLPAAK
jgi:hypothetical protein